MGKVRIGNRHSRAVRTRIDGILFASKNEASEYLRLKLRVIGGEITDMECHPTFPLYVNGFFVGVYTPDFSYKIPGKDSLFVIEVKGRVFSDFPLRRNTFKACYPEHRYFVVKNGVSKEVKLKTREEYEKTTKREF